MPSPDSSALDSLLHERFGFPAFRPGQREAIETLFEHRRLLCIQPTGHGKSLLYQLPSLILPGLTLVISPLLALMRDQIAQLGQRFDIRAATLNSEQTDGDNDAVRARAQAGEVKLLYVSPEQISRVQNEEFFFGLPISLVVIDEAHCISTWGHDFRPSYRQIVHFVRSLEAARADLRILAITATANGRVAEDIVAQIESGGKPVVALRQSSDRTNLQLAVIPRQGMAEKLAYLGALLPKVAGSVLIYCATRARVQSVSDYLVSRGFAAAGYHAGLEVPDKHALQRAFIANDYKIFVATNALGMGIDKPDVRCVIHFDMPGSITAYYQEVGRAGRDGLKAAGRLLFDPGDKKIHEHFIRTSQPSAEDFTQVLRALDGEALGEMALRTKTGLHPTLLSVVIAALVEQGFVTKRAVQRRQVYERAPGNAAPDLSAFAAQAQARKRELAAMVDYATGSDCLMATLRASLGDVAVTPCGRCQRCLLQSSSVEVPSAEVESAAAWLSSRATPIASAARIKLSEGLSLFDQDTAPGVVEALVVSRTVGAGAGLRAKLSHALQAFQPFDAIVAVPSQRWRDREAFAALVGDALGTKVEDALSFITPPAAAQSALSNNDQRRDNVKGTMQARKVSGKKLLLIDDLIGSGATLHEAVRTLRSAGFTGEIVPFTVARVQWTVG